MKEYTFTSESVSEGHPDKVADLISDAIADYIIDNNQSHRAAIETLVTTDKVCVAGEYKSLTTLDNSSIEKIIKQTIQDIGYDQEGFSYKNVHIDIQLDQQSPDIALGTDNFGAGDQGIMFGYACNETEVLMPSPIYYSHKITKALSEARHAGQSWLGPDSKSQITFLYSDINQPVGISNIVCSTQHDANLSIEEVRKEVKKIIEPTLDDYNTSNAKFLINPTGRFVVGGPAGDTGLTGRKIIVDTYGGYAPHGGGAFSGKDCVKVDRSASYMARYLAKNIVASNIANNATIQLSYAIGIPEPTSLYVYADGKVRTDIAAWLKNNIDLTPIGIINQFDLFNMKLTETTNYGHFGRENLPWENIDLTNKLGESRMIL